MAHRVDISDSQHVAVVINDIASYEAFVGARMAKREAELAAIHAKEMSLADGQSKILQAEINLLLEQLATDRNRLANSESSFTEYRARTAELERLLQDATGATRAIGANRIADARAEVERGDYAKADAIFAEVEALERACCSNRIFRRSSPLCRCP